MVDLTRRWQVESTYDVPELKNITLSQNVADVELCSLHEFGVDLKKFKSRVDSTAHGGPHS